MLIPVILFVAVFVLARVGGGLFGGSSQGDNPFLEHPPLAASDTAVARAAANASGGDQQILQRLAEVPQATWLTPETYPVDTVGDAVTKVVAEGERSGRTPVLVVYGITNRDCSGGYSSGGLPADQYGLWVNRIAEAAGHDAAVILEPDALATAAECKQGEERTNLLRAAVDELSEQGSTVYLDAGHASWTPPQEMAAMLSAAGVAEARGFSTNVAGYESQEDEQAYAEAISSALGGTHYVTDTGRNGAGSNGEWCNPDGRSIGREPEPGDSGGLDAYLWIKPPGESDGTCGGGPAAGVFWTDRALSLARAAGW
ncbi:MAG: glycoside hydrolase family 6 protein [Aeromicrobium sp.]